MAQWRKTFYSMGGPERIADPGAEEAARFGALLLQQRAQAEQSALQRQRMDMEQRQYADEGRRADQRMTLEQAARQQQASLAERGFGLDERRIAEQIRSSQAGEQRGISQDALAAELGRGRLGLEREDLGQRRADSDRSYQQRERIAGEEGRRFDLGQAQQRELTDKEIAARAAATAQEVDSRKVLQFLQQRFEEEQGNTAYGRQRDLMGDQLGLEAEGRGRETSRDSAKAAAEAVVAFQQAFAPGVIPDDPNVESAPDGTLRWYESGSDVAPLVDLLERSFGAPTTRDEVSGIKAALEGQLATRFAREAQQQREGWGWDNSNEQEKLRLRLLAELERMAAAHMARVGEAPGPEAPNAPRPRPTPRPAR